MSRPGVPPETRDNPDDPFWQSGDRAALHLVVNRQRFNDGNDACSRLLDLDHLDAAERRIINRQIDQARA